MRCEYCGKSIRDGDAMVRHLDKSKQCHDAHAGRLCRDLRVILAEHKRRAVDAAGGA